MTVTQNSTRPSVLDTAPRFITTEYASLTGAGAPITWPVTPYDGGDTIDVSTGLTYPLKAERARRNPRVALSFSYPVGSGVEDPAVVVVQGIATVRDADLRANSARYIAASAQRFPEATGRVPSFVMARMAWYWSRIWVQVTPVHVRWWPHGDLDQTPLAWHAADATAPPSDPAPDGPSAGSWKTGPAEPWQRRSANAIERLGLPVLTVVDTNGFPLPVRVRAAEATSDGFVVRPPAGVAIGEGPAFLTFHSHPEVFQGQENIGLAGHARVMGDEVHVRVDRALADFPVPRNPLRSAWQMLTAGRALTPRLEHEADRRGQRVPTWAEVRPTRT
jgi:hypothetical protein